MQFDAMNSERRTVAEARPNGLVTAALRQVAARTRTSRRVHNRRRRDREDVCRLTRLCTSAVNANARAIQVGTYSIIKFAPERSSEPFIKLINCRIAASVTI